MYAMCNLHDLSWGNRPDASGGTDMILKERGKQEELKKEYAMFRVNMVVFWVLLNGLYIIFIFAVVGGR